jgi:hypothetical protein
MGTLFVDKLDPQSGTALELGSSGDTMTVPSGATFNVAGTLQSGGVAVSNTPAFFVQRSANQSIATSTLTQIQFDSETLDTDSAFNLGSHRFTPQVSGYYLIGMNVRLTSDQDFDQNYIQINKNSSIVFQSYWENKFYNGHFGQTVIQLNGSTDYVTFYIHQNRGGATDINANGTETFAFGHRILGA